MAEETWGYIALGVGLALFGLIQLLMRKSEEPIGTKFFAGGVLGGGILALLYLTPGRAYVLQSNDDIDKYISFGSYTVVMKNGEVVEQSLPFYDYVIFNNSDRDLVLEAIAYLDEDDEVDYGDFKPVLIAPYGAGVIDSKVDYWPDEEPPESVYTKADSEIRYWLQSY